MERELFEVTDYKGYLRSLLDASGARSGLRTKIAVAMGCHTAYVSKVVKYDAHLSLEQAERLSRFLGHSREASRFFLLLVQKERAGTQQLRQHFEELIEEIRLNRSETLGNGAFFSDEVLRAIELGLSDGNVSLVRIAEHLKMHPRALQRRLLEEKTSYQVLLEAARKAQALAYLEKPGTAIREISQRLGYASPTSFYHAYKRWFGKSPAQRAGE